ncbi:hypothetical protein P152DRAFT_449879 [Eremomyces bilateralis CBS 781.70]|uniref:Xylanolytic transcriptional activator regulatory domain-containing protein n=1 Tax=Eremomyces bilateralis CBS 781.70 TaxID=1392243 RepID=A0A6G1G2E8_9PEZI|nr:uncharacterized protein P152DRAFT_449879 [Eremomyces bilateralis CBS 781.70]KAF1812100.1 hypothetical protein P152DRAFT_449879 [Eremomyces bilateralis CBS 781.70]
MYGKTSQQTRKLTDRTKACRTTSQRPKESKHRVLISSQYERKIDRIEEKLVDIEHLLQNRSLVSEHSNDGASTRSGKSPNAPSGDGISPASHIPDHPTFEGDSSLSAQSTFAHEFLERAISRNSSQDPQMAEALASLRSMVDGQNEPAPTHSRFIDPKNSGASFALPLPPKSLLLDILARSKVADNFFVAMFLPSLDQLRFREIVEIAYDRKEELTITKGLLFFGVAQYMFLEFGKTGPDGRQGDEFLKHVAFCRRNFEYLLSSLPLLLPATSENIEALLLAASYAVEISKPSLCWTITTNAVAMCKTLGYHRISSMKNDSQEVKASKMVNFWLLYIIEKSLALRLGRASNIHDYDISLPSVSSLSFEGYPFGQVLTYWVRVAEIQGKVYEELFSPGASGKSESDRTRSARFLVFEMDDAWSKYQTLSFQPEYGEYMNVLTKSDQVAHQSVLVLIHRAMPPDDFSTSQFSSECLEVSRKALKSHESTSKHFKGKGEEYWSGYLHWAVLQAPFTPYMVLFCHVIASNDDSDLQLLESFVQSLKPSKPQSEGIEKMYRLCYVFHQVAKLYVDSGRKAVEMDLSSLETPGNAAADINFSYGHGQGNAFDPYAFALAFVPNAPFAGDVSGDVPVVPTDGDAMPIDSLGDWFNSHQHIMSLLENDIPEQ